MSKEVDFMFEELDISMRRDDGELIKASSVKECIFEAEAARKYYMDRLDDQKTFKLYSFTVAVLDRLIFRLKGEKSPIQEQIEKYEKEKELINE